jgi:hypothetical protein
MVAEPTAEPLQATALPIVRMAFKQNVSRDVTPGYVSRRTSGGYLTGHQFVHVAPDPLFSRLDGTHQRMPRGMKVSRGVLVLGGIAAAHVPAFQAHAQVDPGVAGLHAVFTNVLVGSGDADLVEVSAL